MLRSGLIGFNQHTNKWYCAADTSLKFHRFKLHSALDNSSPHFVWYGQNPSIRELRTFGCDIYPITSSPKILYDRTQELSFMGYKNSIAEIKWWKPHTKEIKYCSSAKFYELNNKFVKLWSPGSEILIGTNNSTLPTLKLTSPIIPPSKMTYLKSMSISHQEALPLAL